MASLNPFVHPKDLRRRAQGEVLVHRIRRPPLQEEPWHPVHRAFCPSPRMDLRRRPHTAQGPFSHHASTTIKILAHDRVTVWCDRGFFHYDPSCPASSVAPILLPLWDSSWIWYIIITDEEEKGFIVSGKVCGGRLGLRPRHLPLAPVPRG
ncbi:uncharacterized protein [Triticum aestivum]|uniref:uncharacterized protein isoform X1 n=1 Tax=Triticum aestivum TaxID=4565 RepID=UPI000E7941CC|nr:uncharacterized protein LOC123102694 isoform X1 [Triticum aestivum]